MGGWAGNPVGGIRLNPGDRIIVRLVICQKFRSENRFRERSTVVILEGVGGELGQILDRFFTALSVHMVDHAFPHEGSDPDVAVGSAPDGMLDHRIDADKSGIRRNFDLAHDAARTAQDVGQLSLPAAGHSDLVHDAAGGAHHQVFSQLAQFGQVGFRDIEPQVTLQAVQGGDFGRRRAADADIHRHSR